VKATGSGVLEDLTLKKNGLILSFLGWRLNFFWL
jgi:hypothetical protein